MFCLEIVLQCNVLLSLSHSQGKRVSRLHNMTLIISIDLLMCARWVRGDVGLFFMKIMMPICEKTCRQCLNVSLGRWVALQLLTCPSSVKNISWHMCITHVRMFLHFLTVKYYFMLFLFISIWFFVCYWFVWIFFYKALVIRGKSPIWKNYARSWVELETVALQVFFLVFLQF